MDALNRPPIAERRSLIARYAVLFVACVAFHVLGTWTLPLIDRDEPRFAEASREMIQRGDYVVPYFNDQLRFDKPPLTYWAQTVSYRIFGQNDFAARFPSAVAAALTAVAIFTGRHASVQKKSGGGQRLFLPFRCKHFSMQKPRSLTCGWYCLSPLRIGADWNCCETV